MHLKMMRRTALAATLALGTPAGAGGPARLSEADRLAVIESALPVAATTADPTSPAAVMAGLRALPREELRVAAGMPADILPNPEPSSFLVWGALLGGVAAACYGVRRRNVEVKCQGSGTAG